MAVVALPKRVLAIPGKDVKEHVKELNRQTTSFSHDVRDYLANLDKRVATNTGLLASSTYLNVAPPGVQRIFFSNLEKIAGVALTSGVAYWTYVGVTAQPLTLEFIEFLVSVVGAGAQVAELCIASTPSAPNKAAQTLLKLAATGTVNSLLATGVCRNTTSFALQVPAATHLWAGIRTAMAVTQPTIRGLTNDMSQGQILSTAASAVLTTGSSFAGAIIAPAAAPVWNACDLRITMD